jgi:hypothetical protein
MVAILLFRGAKISSSRSKNDTDDVKTAGNLVGKSILFGVSAELSQQFPYVLNKKSALLSKIFLAKHLH